MRNGRRPNPALVQKRVLARAAVATGPAPAPRQEQLAADLAARVKGCGSTSELKELEQGGFVTQTRKR
jgi:hypothetical protein